VAQQPMYQQIADTIRRRIEAGELKRGQQLPTELELRTEFNASRNTIRDAIKRLSGLGLVETRPGQGTFVTKKMDPFVTTLSTDAKSGFGGGEGATYLSEVSEAHRTPRMSGPRVEVQVPPPEVRLRLRLPAGAETVVRQQERFVDEIPWSLQTSFYPMDFIRRGATKLLTADNIHPGTVAYLADTIKIKQIGYRDWITARQPNEYEQKFFDIAHDATVFELFRTAFDESKEPMRVTVTVFPVDRNQFIYDVGDNLPEPKYDDLNSSGA
jgi:GntR family transcriptional regulator